MPTTRYDYDVFVNCPFDPEYRPMLYALVFTVHDCGFRARCTLEVDDSGLVRIENIYRLVGECRFGIHDISRTELDEANGLPRFNMPLELGVFLGAARFGRGRQREKRSLILDREPYRYQKYVSDIAGQDIRSHHARPEEAIRRVRDWLDNAPLDPEVIRPAGGLVAERYARFMAELPAVSEAARLDPDELTFNNFTTLLVEWLEFNDW